MGEMHPQAIEAGDQIGPMVCSFSMRWRPTPNVFDGRIKLLQSLEEQKRLRAFKVGHEDAHGMITSEIEFEVAPNHVNIFMLGNLARNSDFIALLETLLREIEPRVTALHVHFKHLLKISNQTDYSSARIAAIQNVFSSPVKELGFSDSAILVDGAVPGKSLSYVAEFGIVDKDEAWARLSNLTKGQMPAEDESRFTAVRLLENLSRPSLPEIGLFIDSGWNSEQKIPRSLTAAWCDDHLQNTCIEAASLANKLLAVVSRSESKGIDNKGVEK
jgi:hypothetical protein